MLAAWRALRRWPTYPAARRLWLRDLERDRSANRVRRFGQALVLAAELPADVGLLYAHYLHTPASVTRYAALLKGLDWCASAHAKDVWTTPEWEQREKLADCRWLTVCSAGNASHLRALAPDGKVVLTYHGLDAERFPAPGREVGPDGSDPARPGAAPGRRPPGAQEGHRGSARSAGVAAGGPALALHPRGRRPAAPGARGEGGQARPRRADPLAGRAGAGSGAGRLPARGSVRAREPDRRRWRSRRPAERAARGGCPAARRGREPDRRDPGADRGRRQWPARAPGRAAGAGRSPGGADRRSGPAPAPRPGGPGPGAGTVRRRRRPRSASRPGSPPPSSRAARSRHDPAGRLLCAHEAARSSDPVGRPAHGAGAAAGARAHRPAGRAREPAAQLRPDRRSGPPAPDRGAGRPSRGPPAGALSRASAGRAAWSLAHVSRLSQVAGLARAHGRGRARHPLSARRDLVRAQAGGRPLRTRPCGDRAGDPPSRRRPGPDRSGCRMPGAPGLAAGRAAPAAALPRPRPLPGWRAPRASAIGPSWRRGSASILRHHGCSWSP